MNPSRNYILVRLSRAEVQGEGTLEDKFANRIAQCHELAARHGLTVPEENVIVEQKSGGKLADRPDMLRLLDLCTRGQVDHLITTHMDRISRGDKRDEQEIEDAFVDGCVRVITHDGVEVYDDKRDPLPTEVRLMFARGERRKYIKKLRDAVHVNLKKGWRPCSRPPYGYKRIGVVDSVDTYEVIDNQWPVVEAIFADGLSAESLSLIARKLNRQGIPSPRGALWSPEGVRAILLNPFYAGYQSLKSWTRRDGKRIAYSPSDFTLSSVQGTWRCPITLENWQYLTGRYGRTGSKPFPRGSRLLSGVLYCCEGGRMTYNNNVYLCWHGRHNARHPGGSVGREKIERWVKAAITAMLERLPVDYLEWAAPRPAIDLAQVRAAASEARSVLNDLEAGWQSLTAAWGEKRYIELCLKARERWEELAESQAIAERAANAPDTARVRPLLESLRSRGLESIWDTSEELQRQLVAALIERIDIHKPEGLFVKGATITWWPDWEQYGEREPPLPVR